MEQLVPAVAQWCLMEGHKIDSQAIGKSIAQMALSRVGDPRLQFTSLACALDLHIDEWMAWPDPSLLPFFAYDEELGWRLLVKLDFQGRWLSRSMSEFINSNSMEYFEIEPSKQFYIHVKQQPRSIFFSSLNFIFK